MSFLLTRTQILKKDTTPCVHQILFVPLHKILIIPLRSIEHMNKVCITAIRQTVYSDLIARYENPIEHACDIRQGQQWTSVNGKRPEGLCPSAWESMRPFVESLAQGKGNFFDGWMKDPMSAMISCNDGFRPFSFYIEAIENSASSHE